MPIYTFRNKSKNNKKTWDIEMSMANRELYLKDNPDFEQVLHTMNIGDSVRLGITKPPADFQKYVIGRIKETNKGAKMGRKFNIPKEV